MRLKALAVFVVLSYVSPYALCAPTTQPSTAKSPNEVVLSVRIGELQREVRVQLQRTVEDKINFEGMPRGSQPHNFNGITFYIVPLIGG